MPLNTIVEQLNLINNVYKHPLEEKEYTESMPHIRKNLYHHQRILVNAMRSHVEKSTAGYRIDSQWIHSKIGIIADPPGTGKTLSVLSYLSSIKTNPFDTLRLGELSQASNRYFFSNTIEEPRNSVTDASHIDLIIVPPHLFNTWLDEINNSTTFSVLPVESKRVLRYRSTLGLITSAHIVLTTNKTYRYLQEFAQEKGIRWRNIFIDEASTIHLTVNDPIFEFDFLWLISSEWLPFLFKNTFLSPPNLIYNQDSVNLHYETQKWLQGVQNYNQIKVLLHSVSFLKNFVPFAHDARWSLILRNSESTLHNSFELPQIFTQIIQCKVNYTLNNLRLIPSAQLSEKIPSIVRALEISEYSQEQFLEKHPTRTDLIMHKIADDCSICLSSPSNMLITSCCMNVFCGHCLLQHLITSNNCPTCRSHLSLNLLAYLPNELSSSSTTLSPLLTKQEQCIDLIRRNPEGKFLIYTAFANTFYQILQELDELHIHSERVTTTNGGRVARNFASGHTRVVFVSDTQDISGLNFTQATHFVFFFDQAFSERYSQMLSAVQRLPRTTPLNAIRLVFEEL